MVRKRKALIQSIQYRQCYGMDSVPFLRKEGNRLRHTGYSTHGNVAFTSLRVTAMAIGLSSIKDGVIKVCIAEVVIG